MSKCEACERGDHANCGLQTWCDCENETDGEAHFDQSFPTFATIKDKDEQLDRLYTDIDPDSLPDNFGTPEDIAAATEPLVRGEEQVRVYAQRILDDLNPTERAILAKRFGKASP